MKIDQGVKHRGNFKDGNIFGKWVTPDLYAVYSYGEHWILALWTEATGWLVNETSYPSPSTKRHQRFVNTLIPVDHNTYMFRDQETLQAMALAKPTTQQITDKQMNLFDVST